MAQIGYLYGVKFTSATHGAVCSHSFRFNNGSSNCGAKARRGLKRKKNLQPCLLCLWCFCGSSGLGSSRKHAASATGAGTTLVPKDAAAKSYPIAGTSLLFEVIGVALYFVVLPILTRFYNGAWLTTILYFIGPMFVASFFLLIEIEPLKSYHWSIDRQLIFSMTYCVATTIFYNYAIVYSSKYLEPSFASLFACAHPIATSILSILILSHPISSFDFLGGALIVVGFYQAAQSKLGSEKRDEFEFDIEDSSRAMQKKFKPYRDGTSSSSDDDEIGELEEDSSSTSDVSL